MKQDTDLKAYLLMLKGISKQNEKDINKDNIKINNNLTKKYK